MWYIWLKKSDHGYKQYNWTQDNAVFAPLVIAIQRSYTSNFIKTPRDPKLPVAKRKADVQFPHLWSSSLTTQYKTYNAKLYSVVGIWVIYRRFTSLRDSGWDIVFPHCSVCNLFVCKQHCRKTVTVIVMKLSPHTGNGYCIIPLNSPGGNALMWGAGRHLLCTTRFHW